MGEMLVGILAGNETHELNRTFGNEKDEKRKNLAKRVVKIRKEIPYLLIAPTETTFPPANRRQRSLRLAATELTRHVDYRRSDPGRGNHRDFLRWLTWLEKDEANWNQAVKITKVLSHFVKHQEGTTDKVPPRVVFDWEEHAADLEITVSPADYETSNPARIDILVKAPDAFHVTADEED